MDIIQDESSGGQVQYKLSRSPISVSYVWVYKNGLRLRQDKDYYVSLPRAVVYITADTTPADTIKIVNFANDIFKLPRINSYHTEVDGGGIFIFTHVLMLIPLVVGFNVVVGRVTLVDVVEVVHSILVIPTLLSVDNDNPLIVAVILLPIEP